MPTLSGATLWINRTVSQEDLLGKPVLFQFWAISCPVCKLNMPKLQHFVDSYQAQGLQLVSVHAPRGEADTNVEKVKSAIAEMMLVGPCAIDNEHTISNSFQTGGIWPCYLLFDARGKLCSRAAGVTGIRMAQNSLKRLLELQTVP